MSVCASANPFNSRQSSVATSGGRRPAPGLTNDERWVALNKNIFQDILNAILIQTTFSSATAGKRHLSPRPDVSLHSSSPSAASLSSPLSFTAAADASATPHPISGCLKESKDAIRRAIESTALDLIPAKSEALEEKSDDRFPCESTDLQCGRSLLGEMETFPIRVNGRHPAVLEVGELPLRAAKELSTGSSEEGSKGVGCSELVSSSRLRDKMSSVFSRVGGGAYEESLLNDSRLSVFCEETYVGRVPMMIIGLRPYLASDTKLSCLLDPTNQITSLQSNVLQMCPTNTTKEISANSGLDLLKSRNSSPLLLMDARRDQYDRCVAKTTAGRFLAPQPTDQLHINTTSGGGGVTKSGHRFFRSTYYPQHHSENKHSGANKSSSKSCPADVQSKCESTKEASAEVIGKDLSRKSSRDHSILTILGLLSSTEEEDDDNHHKQSSSVKSHGGGVGGGEATEAGTGVDRSRLLGIGVTVIGRSRWMAVDKCIVYDMIDQVLNGEHDYFTSTDDESFYSPSQPPGSSSRPQVRLSPQTVVDRRRCGVLADGNGRRRGHHLPRTQRNCPTFLGPYMNASSHDVKRKMECGIEDDLKQSHDMDFLPTSSSSSSSSSSASFVSPTMSTCQERPISSKPANTIPCESPPARDRLPSSSKSLEGVSVLRSLLSDDPVEICHGGPPATDVMTQTPPLTIREGTRTPQNPSVSRMDDAVDFSNKTTAADDVKRVKRSRHSSVADGKKRRVSGTGGHPSMTNQVLLPDDSISSSRSCSVPASVASTMMPDHHGHASKSSNSIKWKSSMLMRMRTEEGGIDNDDDGN